MTIFLRNSKKQSIVDIEVSENDVCSAVSIEFYSQLLLENLHRREEVITDFTQIDELRQWFWEVYTENADAPSLNDLLRQLEMILLPIADKYNLYYITD